MPAVINTLGNSMRHLFAVCLAALLTACGGGGGGDSPAATRVAVTGVLHFGTGTVLPDPATVAQALQVSVAVELVGSSAPVQAHLAIPFDVTRTTGGAAVYHGVVDLAPKVAGYIGIATLTIPAGQPVGINTYCVRLLPNDAYAYSGTIDSPVCGTVNVTP
jgi:hypothetical protein